jgi:hypothetical protein
MIFFKILNNILSSTVDKHLRRFLSSSFEGSATLSSGRCHATLHHPVLDSWTDHLCSIVIKQPKYASKKYQYFINTFLDLPQHVSASHCRHQGVVVTSEATVWVMKSRRIRWAGHVARMGKGEACTGFWWET